MPLPAWILPRWWFRFRAWVRPGYDFTVAPEHPDPSQQVGKSPDQATRNGEETPLASDPSRLIP
jgi:hypothetical protein